jgi:hypothetical protein
MPKNKVSDPITDQEIAFARLVLSGAMTDRHAAEAAGLNPDSAAYTKSKPRVRDFMLQHRAAVQQQLVQQEADLSRRAVDGLHRVNLDREQVLNRLWEIANLSPETTRGSVTGQVRALSMIVAMQNFIPNPRAVAAEKKSAPPPVHSEIYASAWRRKQQDTTNDPPPSPAAAQEGDRSVGPAPASAADAPPDPGPSRSTFANRFTPSEATAPYVPLFGSVPDLRVGFSVKNPFVRPR